MLFYGILSSTGPPFSLTISQPHPSKSLKNSEGAWYSRLPVRSVADCTCHTHQ
ncbi:uncharacterized protein LACBIDRAFT_296925 [Laccaria bicolor S238N-H82]|uniref:Predicted protein n=1 Tax=Laccaria bicolor (strain S238N-H82 / ATCC MYA-4686) TaxID=486041 RepID=B0D9K6_LACBS|nr:uncharacterized protein LACBIDRAFT_296925 [Laccaria bicolor S238N-H82]EDR08598.1 predicted protein [Laccaria bicolor S238N-H82]|eukprot:XP_001880823.1 predicted protein [Laccaria bicolor S238N-H82]